MNKFQQYQMGEAMTVAAANPSGGAGAGVGLGMGFGMANQMAQNLGKVGGGAAAYRLIGGSLIPVSINLQGGVASFSD
jgi:membrane protease subunit (stomatin/prohibitin family)